MTRFPNAPPRIAELPVSDKGFPIPWFVPWIDGKPDFRAVQPERILEARRKNVCWICGGKLASVKAFAIGPMCGVNRVSAEPPSHYHCARFAVEACPFLSRPLSRRADTSDLEHKAPAGIMLAHNPGMTLIWVTQSYRFVRETKHTGLFHVGSPLRVEWYREGRSATQQEVMDALALGLPKLADMAAQDGPEAVQALTEQALRLVKWIPASEHAR